MPKRIEKIVTEVPGPRTRITVDLAERSLPLLIEGEDVDHLRLVPNEDGSYALRADTRIGATRRSGIRPVMDVLIEALNGFVDVLEAHDADVPDAVGEAWDTVVERMENYRGELHRAEDES